MEKINPNLIVCDPEGNAYTVRYEAMNAMLLHEFLKEHRKVEQQQAVDMHPVLMCMFLVVFVSRESAGGE